MSSRIPGGDGSSSMQRIVWRKVGEGVAGVVSGGPAPVASAGLGLIPAESDSHRAKLNQLSAETEQRARQQGFQEGEAAAQKQAAQQLQQAMQRIGQSVEETLAARLRMRQQMEQDLVHLAIEVARRVLHRELTVDPEALLGIVKAAIQRIDARELHRLRVSPADAKLLEQQLAALPLPARVEITPDPALPRGSVILETARGSLDSSVDTQLQEIDRGFADLVRGKS